MRKKGYYKSQWQRFNLSRLKSGRNDALLQPFLSHFSYAMNCRLRRQENREKLEHQVRAKKRAFYVFQVFLSLFPHQYQIIWIWFLFGANRIVPSPKCWSDRLSPNWPICWSSILKRKKNEFQKNEIICQKIAPFADFQHLAFFCQSWFIASKCVLSF